MQEGTEQHSSGYDYEFECDPPQELCCLICLLPARDPQQARCGCASLYCLACVQTWRKASPLCPTCKQALDTFPDGLSSRRIRALKVKCRLEPNKCPWVGELGEHEAHLKKCDYAPVPCPNLCGETVARGNLGPHTSDVCVMRQYVCPQCGEAGPYLRVVDPAHLEGECPGRVVACPNPGCSTLLERRHLDSHLSTCLHTTAFCPYQPVGCTFAGTTEEVSGHESSSLRHHLDLTMRFTLEALGAERRELKVEEGPAGGKKKPGSAAVFKMPDFARRMTYKDAWHSPDFCSHPNGYELSLAVVAWGWGGGEGTHVSLFVRLLKGKNDAHLVWPLCARVTVTLLNQLRDAEHRESVLTVEAKDGWYPVTSKGEVRALNALTFVPHGDLALSEERGCQYLKDDAVFFRVEVDILPSGRPWLMTSS